MCYWSQQHDWLDRVCCSGDSQCDVSPLPLQLWQGMLSGWVRLLEPSVGSRSWPACMPWGASAQWCALMVGSESFAAEHAPRASLKAAVHSLTA
jgi:hypothetical protein